jgi:hypothetical protein
MFQAATHIGAMFRLIRSCAGPSQLLMIFLASPLKTGRHKDFERKSFFKNEGLEKNQQKKLTVLNPPHDTPIP